MRKPTDQEILDRVLSEYDDGFFNAFPRGSAAARVVKPGHRIWGKAVRHGGHYLWVGSLDARGYPVIRIDGRLRSVRRVIFGERLPPETFVRAGCGVRGCVHPEHLELWRKENG